MKGNRKSKGFFFVLISFILVLYIFAYLTAWTNAMEMSEKVSSDKFRDVNAESIAAQLTNERFSDFFEIAGYYALFSINNYSSDSAHTLRYESTQEMKYLNSSFFGLVLIGKSNDFESSAGVAQKLEYSQYENDTYTYAAWFRALNRTASQAGLEIKKFEFYNYSMNQTGRFNFTASMNVDFYAEDRLGTLGINRTFFILRNFSITGLQDPMVARESRDHISATNVVEKQMFYDSTLPSALAPQSRGTANSQGQGFFYGKVVLPSGAASISSKSEYILAGDFNDIISTTGWQLFGAYLVTSAPIIYSNSCDDDSERDAFYEISYTRPPDICEERTYANGTNYTYCEEQDCIMNVDHLTSTPFIVAPGFSPSAGEPLLIVAGPNSPSAGNPFLKYTVVSTYNIENLKGAAACAKYRPSTRGPSYPQRLTKDALTLNSPMGIESFVLGKWAGGVDKPIWDGYSRLDFEFFQFINGDKLRGMPGCKSLGMCSASGATSPLGHFVLSNQAMIDYGAGVLSCDDDRAGCG